MLYSLLNQNSGEKNKTYLKLYNKITDSGFSILNGFTNFSFKKAMNSTNNSNNSSSNSFKYPKNRQFFNNKSNHSQSNNSKNFNNSHNRLNENTTNDNFDNKKLRNESSTAPAFSDNNNSNLNVEFNFFLIFLEIKKLVQY